MRLRSLGVGIVPVAVFLACGDSDSEKPPARDLTTVACADGERKTGSACVPAAFFDDVTIPNPAQMKPIDEDPDGTRYVRGVLLVTLRDSKTTRGDAEALFLRHGGIMLGAIPFGAFYTVSFTGADDTTKLAAKEAELAADPAVFGVLRDIETANALLAPERPTDTDLEKLASTEKVHDIYELVPDDEDLGSAGGKLAYESVGLPRAWNALYTQNHPLEPVVVGVLDGRVEQARFPGLTFAGSRDFRVFAEERADSSTVRHGTAVASVIAAPSGDGATNGYLGGLECTRHDLAAIAVSEEGAADRLKNEDKRSFILTDAIFYGIVFAVQAGARVVNISLAQTGGGTLVSQLVYAYRLVMARAHDTLFVIGAGNDDQDGAFYVPCAAARSDTEGAIGNALCVAAIDERDAKAVWKNPKTSKPAGASNHNIGGQTIGLAAPGIRVLAQLPDGRLTMFEGTSAATPMVSGAASLLFSVLPGLDGALAKKILIDSAAPISDGSLSGRKLNAGAAVEKALALATALHPERAGTGTCRAPDAPDASASDGASPAVYPLCRVGKKAQDCKFCSGADYDITFPTQPSNGGAGKARSPFGVTTFVWDTDTNVSAFSFELRAEDGTLGVVVKYAPDDGKGAPTISGSSHRDGTIDLRVQRTDTGLGSIVPRDNVTTFDAGVAVTKSERITSFEFIGSMANGGFNGQLTAHGIQGATAKVTLTDIAFGTALGGCF